MAESGPRSGPGPRDLRRWRAGAQAGAIAARRRPELGALSHAVYNCASCRSPAGCHVCIVSMSSLPLPARRSHLRRPVLVRGLARHVLSAILVLLAVLSAATSTAQGAPSAGFSPRAPIGQIAMDSRTTCAVDASSHVRCWGENVESQARPPSDLGAVSAVAVGNATACAITAAASVRCWGHNTLGQANVPPDLGPVRQVVPLQQGTCALKFDGAVRCWGYTPTSGNGLLVPSDLGPVRELAGAGMDLCAVVAAGTVRCWGQVDGGMTSVPPALGPVLHISATGERCARSSSTAPRTAGCAHVGPGRSRQSARALGVLQRGCAVLMSGSVRCWGNFMDSVPADLGPVVGLVLEDMTVCAVRADGSARCWGDGRRGQTSVPADLGPVAVPVVSTEESGSGCGINPDGSVACWGANGSGQTNVPSDLGPVRSLHSGYAYSCAVTVASVARCWGRDLFGNAKVPSEIGLVRSVAPQLNQTCVVDAGGAARCWGRGYTGAQLAYPNSVRQITGLPDAFCAVTGAGGVACWGSNSDGQTSIPGDLAPQREIASSSGEAAGCGVAVTGIVRCWGSVGAGNTDVPADLGVVRTASGGVGPSCATTATFQVVCWGSTSRAPAPGRCRRISRPCSSSPGLQAALRGFRWRSGRLLGSGVGLGSTVSGTMPTWLGKRSASIPLSTTGSGAAFRVTSGALPDGLTLSPTARSPVCRRPTARRRRSG